MRNMLLALTAGLLAVACSPQTDLSEIDASSGELQVFAASPDEKIRIVGSSTVAPFSTTVSAGEKRKIIAGQPDSSPN